MHEREENGEAMSIMSSESVEREQRDHMHLMHGDSCKAVSWPTRKQSLPSAPGFGSQRYVNLCYIKLLVGCWLLQSRVVELLTLKRRALSKDHGKAYFKFC